MVELDTEVLLKSTLDLVKLLPVSYLAKDKLTSRLKPSKVTRGVSGVRMDSRSWK